GEGGSATRVGNSLNRFVWWIATALQKCLYAFMWVVWPRAVHWAVWLPVVGIFVAGIHYSIVWNRKRLSHGWFTPNAWRISSPRWLSAVALSCLLACLVWPVPVYPILPILALLAWGVGWLIAKSLPQPGFAPE